MQLALTLLGPFSAAVNEQPIPASRTKKIEALLAYLVVEGDRAQRRENLMGLLFPEMADEVASTNLRQTLTRLRHAIQDEAATPPFLTIERETIQFNRQSDHWCDLLAFNALLAGCAEHPIRPDGSCVYCMTRLREAVDLYRGPFLADFFLADCAAFEAWAATHRESWQQAALAALAALTTFYSRRGEYAQAIVYAQRQVALEPWQEEAHQLLMRLLARLGQRTAALAQYKRCVAALQQELDVEPALATTALRDQIAALGETRPYHLPTVDDSLIGRSAELAQIYAHFADNTARPLTLVGAGGIGKTRLALEAGWRIAQELLGPFLHGVYFVSLADMEHAVDVAQALMIAIADSLGLALVGVRSPLDVVLGYVQDKELLLLLDNCEEAGSAIELAARLLKRAPGLQILATSRAPLDLANEGLLRLEGLPFPPAEAQFPGATANQSVRGGGSTGDEVRVAPENYQALQLFAHHAQRADATFVWDQVAASEQQAVARICQVCEGMPLALAMAAVWVSTLPCQELATEIERNFDILQSSQRQAPARHQSIRAVFDYSWARLTAAERRVFAQCAVFRGGFDRKAAQAITGVTLPLLASLVRKSLLRYAQSGQGDAGRYLLHPLLRQYAQEKLNADGTLAAEVAARHGRYYCAWLRQQTPTLQGGEQPRAIAAVTLEFTNVRAAWQWAVEHEDASALDQAVTGLTDFCELRGLFNEGAEPLGQAVSQLQSAQRATEDDATAIVVAKTLARQGWLNFLLGRSAVAQKQLEEGVGILRVLAVEAELVTPLNYLAYVAYCTDQYALGLQLGSEAGELAQRRQDKLGLANAYRTTAAIAKIKGEFSASIQQYELAIAAYRDIGNGQGTIWSLLGLSTCAGAQGDYKTAIARVQEVIALAKQIGFRLAEGWGLYSLGYLYLQQCNYAAALPQLAEALQVGRELHDRRQQASVLNWLGTCLRDQGDWVGATVYYEQALPIYRETSNVLGEGLALNDLAIVARYQREYTRGQELGRQALKLGQEIGNRDLQRRALSHLGHGYSDQKRYFQAVAAYEEALEKAEGAQPLQRLHPLSGLALIAIHEGKPEQAGTLLDAALLILKTHPLDGTDEPRRILSNLSTVMVAVGHPLAERFLADAQPPLPAPGEIIHSP